MPARPDSQTDFVRPRWSAYVRSFVDSGVITRTRLATLSEVPTSRVTEWIDAERAVEAETAFQIGETLRNAGFSTNGFCALYACGYTADLFMRLRSLTGSTSASNASRRSALALYCGLPARMLAHELSIAEAHAGWRLPGSRKHADSYEFSRLKVAQATAVRRQSQTARLFVKVEAQQHLEEPTIQAILQSAATETDMRISVKFLSHLALSYQIAGEIDERFPPLQERTVKTHLRDDAGRVIIDIVIAVARAVRTYDPATMTPRLWRMAREWAYGIDPRSFTRWQPIVPAPYRSFRDDDP